MHKFCSSKFSFLPALVLLALIQMYQLWLSSAKGLILQGRISKSKMKKALFCADLDNLFYIGVQRKEPVGEISK